MRRFWASLGSILFFMIAPGTVAGLVPWWITQWQLGAPFGDAEISRWLGAVLIIVGLMPLIASFARFAWEGLGTPAPIAPPSRLVITGFYRRVRNPMYFALGAEYETYRANVPRWLPRLKAWVTPSP